MEQTKPSPSEDAASAVRQTPRWYISVMLQELRLLISEDALGMRGGVAPGPQIAEL